MNQPLGKSSITRAAFGIAPDNQPVEIFTLRNVRGAEARITNYGGIVQSLKVSDRHGNVADVVLGYDDLAGYVARTPYFGALVGRYANRIAKGKFTLDGKEYRLATNNGPNSLHGGARGFDKVVWKAKPTMTPEGPSLELSYVSKDGEEGYPGNLSVVAVYTLTEEMALRVEISAVTDRKTVCNLTHHSYFNLRGSGDILGHMLQINADCTTPVNADLIPTGELEPVTGSPFDFRKPTPIGARIDDPHPVLRHGRGYDHNYVINKAPGALEFLARVTEPESGRALEVWSTEPGMQFYAGTTLDGSIRGKGGVAYQRYAGFCLEPQHFPDSPNQPKFPGTELEPGKTFKSTMLFKFSNQ